MNDNFRNFLLLMLLATSILSYHLIRQRMAEKRSRLEIRITSDAGLYIEEEPATWASLSTAMESFRKRSWDTTCQQPMGCVVLSCPIDTPYQEVNNIFRKGYSNYIHSYLIRIQYVGHYKVHLPLNTSTSFSITKELNSSEGIAYIGKKGELNEESLSAYNITDDIKYFSAIADFQKHLRMSANTSNNVFLIFNNDAVSAADALACLEELHHAQRLFLGLIENDKLMEFVFIRKVEQVD